MASEKFNAMKQRLGNAWDIFSPTQKKILSVSALATVTLTLMLYGLSDPKQANTTTGYVSPEAEVPQINLVATQKLDEFTLASLSNTIESQKKEIEELKKFKQNFAGLSEEITQLKIAAEEQRKASSDQSALQSEQQAELAQYKKTMELLTMLSSAEAKDKHALYYMYLDNDDSKRDPLVEKIIGFDKDKYLASLQDKVVQEESEGAVTDAGSKPEPNPGTAQPYVNRPSVKLASAKPKKRLNGHGQEDDSFCYDRDASMILYNESNGQVNRDPSRGNEKLEPLKINSISTSNNSKDIHLPATSVFKAQLLTGLDAPTSDGAKSDPFPILLKLTNVDFLPNRFRTDLNECFVLASSYGDLSSERAYMRTQTISCITKTGFIAEGEVKGYINGPDGKAGVAGRLVSREGQLIAKSLAVGFMQGAINALTKQSNVVVTDQSKVADILKQGSIGGASKTIDRIANYYLAVANKTFPLVEVNAGQPIDIILTSPLTLKITNRKVNSQPLKIRTL